jgi:uncharacterized membrane protein
LPAEILLVVAASFSSTARGRRFPMAEIDTDVVVEVPIQVAYNQWTQFETFPSFMEGVKEVQQLDDRTLRWRAQIGGKALEWTATITAQEPDHRIAWRSTSGNSNAGAVLFEPEGPNRTRVKLHVVYQPEGPIEKTGSALGAVTARVHGDLKRFKSFIEQRGLESGGWRGEIHGREVQRPGEREAERELGA